MDEMDPKSDPDAPFKEIQGKLDHLSKCVGDLGEFIEKITQENLDEYLMKSDQMENARVYHILAFIINALSFAYIKICGQSVESHPVMAEIERLRRYYIRLYDNEKRESNDLKRVRTTVASNVIKRSLSGQKEFSDEIKKSRDRKSAKTGSTSSKLRRDTTKILEEIKNSLR